MRKEGSQDLPNEEKNDGSNECEKRNEPRERSQRAMPTDEWHREPRSVKYSEQSNIRALSERTVSECDLKKGYGGESRALSDKNEGATIQ